MFLTGSISPASAVISIVLTAFAVLFALFLLLPLKISLKGFFSSDDIYFDADIGFTGIFKFIPTIKIRSDKILALIGRRLRKKAKSNRNTQAKNEPISQTDKKTENNLSDGSKSDKLRKTQTKKKTYAQCRSEAQIKDKEDKRGFIDFIKNFVKKYYRPYIEPNKKYFIKTCRSILKIIKNFFAKIKVISPQIDILSGTGDSASTAILTGVFYTLLSLPAAIIYSFTKSEPLSVNITPCYEKICFELKIGGILAIKPVHIIYITIACLWRLLTFALTALGVTALKQALHTHKKRKEA